jgi:hypothetical protein
MDHAITLTYDSPHHHCFTFIGAQLRRTLRLYAHPLFVTTVMVTDGAAGYHQLDASLLLLGVCRSGAICRINHSRLHIPLSIGKYSLLFIVLLLSLCHLPSVVVDVDMLFAKCMCVDAVEPFTFFLIRSCTTFTSVRARCS